MRQRIYPGANLAVVDVSGLLTCEVAALGALPPALASARELERVQRDEHAMTPARAPIIVPPGYQSVLNVDLFRGGECRGGIVMIIRPSTRSRAPAERSQGLRTRLLSQTIDLDRESALSASFVLLQDESHAGLDAPPRVAQTRALEVSPSEAVRLNLDGAGRRSRTVIKSPAGVALAWLDVNAWTVSSWWTRRSTRGLRADLSIRASNLNVYDFGSPPHVQRDLQDPVHKVALGATGS